MNKNYHINAATKSKASKYNPAPQKISKVN